MQSGGVLHTYINKDTQECMLGSTEELHKLNSEINTLTRLMEKLYRHVANTQGIPFPKKMEEKDGVSSELFKE